MKSRIFWSIVGLAAVAVVLFGVPLGIAADRLYRSQQITDLQRRAAQAANAMPETGLHGAEPIVLPDVDDDYHLALYDSQGARVVGSGPAKGDRDVLAALAGRVSEHSTRDWMSVTVPLRDEDRTVGAARAAVRSELVLRRVERVWLAMGLFGVGALGVAALLARRQARYVAAPVRDLTLAAERLGQGDFTVRLGRYGLGDIDTVAEAMDRTAKRLGDLVERERSFSSAASHQLNTPLTTMRLALESALLSPEADRDTAIKDAVHELEQLQRTVDGLLSLTRDDVRAAVPADPVALCLEAAERWRGPLDASGRKLELELEPELRAVRSSEHAVRETLQVLLDNAARHGKGTVTLRGRHAGSGVVLEVEDEGDGFDGDPETLLTRAEPRAGHGIGLRLARRLIETQGGRLAIRHSGAHPVFVVAMPGAKPPGMVETAPRAGDRMVRT